MELLATGLSPFRCSGCRIDQGPRGQRGSRKAVQRERMARNRARQRERWEWASGRTSGSRRSGVGEEWGGAGPRRATDRLDRRDHLVLRHREAFRASSEHDLPPRRANLSTDAAAVLRTSLLADPIRGRGSAHDGDGLDRRRDDSGPAHREGFPRASFEEHEAVALPSLGPGYPPSLRRGSARRDGRPGARPPGDRVQGARRPASGTEKRSPSVVSKRTWSSRLLIAARRCAGRP